MLRTTERAEMKIHWVLKNIVVDAPNLTIDAIPSLRLVRSHAPRQRIEVKIGTRLHIVELKDLDLEHHSLVRLNGANNQENTDRAQLASLSGIHEVCPPRYLSLILPPPLDAKE